MKKAIKNFTLMSILFALFASDTIAQDNNKSFLNIHLGLAFPTSDYASTDPNNEKSGYAQTGFAGALKYTQMLGYEFGISFAIRRQTNPINTSELLLQALQQSPGISAFITPASWSSTVYMFGGEFLESIAPSSKTFFDMSFMIGYMSTTFPAIDVTLSSGANSGYIHYPELQAGAFAFSFAAGFYFGVSEKISIPLTIDYTGGTPHFDSYVVSTSAGPMDQNSFDQPVNNFNLMTGIIIQLN